MKRTIFLTAMLLGSSGAAQATSMVKFVYTGDATIEFQLPKSPSPTISLSNFFRIDNVSVNYNGTVGTYEVLTQTNPSNFSQGGFRLFNVALQEVTFGGEGAQIFSGLTSAPTFITGTYSLTAFYTDAPGTGQLVISDVGGGAVPEPASWAMLLAGFGLTGLAMRRRAALAA
jgi:PEP-CTERM motif